MKKTMNLMMRVAALALAVVMLAVSVSATELTYKDITSKHWAYDAIKYVTNEGFMHGSGSTAGELFNPDGEVNAAEIYATLYRIAGEPEIQPVIYADYYYSKSYRKWSDLPTRWAIENGIAECSAGYVMIGNAVDVSTEEIRRVGYRLFREGDDEFLRECPKPGIFFRIETKESDVFRSATRTDIVLALYYYVSSYLYGTVDASADLSGYSDFAAYTKSLELSEDGTDTNYKTNPGVYFPTQDEFESAWRWAVTAGIIEGYPDGTLGVSNAELYTVSHTSDIPRVIATEAKYVTRAEYAQMLERFVKYLRDGNVIDRTYLVVTDEVAEVTNAEGERLICNDGEFSGTMQVFAKQEIVNGGFPAYRKAWLVTVNKSESFSYKYKEN